MGLLGGDLWDDIVDIRDKHKKKASGSSPQNDPGSPVPINSGGKRASGLTIFYRVLGTLLLLATMIKSWFTAAAIFDWVMMAVGLLLIGVHRWLTAESVLERLRPAFLNLHERLKAVESKLDAEKETEDQSSEAPR